MRRWFTESLGCLSFEIKEKRVREISNIKESTKNKIIDNYELQRNKTDLNMLIY